MVPELSICWLSDFAMDTAQEARCKEMLDQILAMAKKMALDLEACNADLRAACPPSSPPSTSILTADTEERKASASTISTKPATTSSASVIPSPTSAPPQDVDHGFQSGVSEVSTEGELPDSLLRDIVSRLPINYSQFTEQLLPKFLWSIVCSEVGFPCVFRSAIVSKGPEMLSYPTAQFHFFTDYMESHLSWSTVAQLLSMDDTARLKVKTNTMSSSFEGPQ